MTGMSLVWIESRAQQWRTQWKKKINQTNMCNNRRNPHRQWMQFVISLRLFMSVGRWAVPSVDDEAQITMVLLQTGGIVGWSSSWHRCSKNPELNMFTELFVERGSHCKQVICHTCSNTLAAQQSAVCVYAYSHDSWKWEYYDKRKHTHIYAYYRVYKVQDHQGLKTCMSVSINIVSDSNE